jgi:hypothetical protein
VKNREQLLPPTAVAGFNTEAGAAKDRSPVPNIKPDRTLISLKGMPIAPVAANHDARDVACWKIDALAVERAAVINHFERRQNSALLGIIEFDRFICEPCRNRRECHSKISFRCIQSSCYALGLLFVSCFLLGGNCPPKLPPFAMAAYFFPFDAKEEQRK